MVLNRLGMVVAISVLNLLSSFTLTERFLLETNIGDSSKTEAWLLLFFLSLSLFCAQEENIKGVPGPVERAPCSWAVVRLNGGDKGDG